MKKLSELIKEVKIISTYGDIDKEITSIAYNSGSVKKGGIFFAVGGFIRDGNKFIDDAVKRGAVAIVSERDCTNKNVTWVQVDSCRNALSAMSDVYYDHPSGQLDLIGITGTNGKTTTAYLSDSVLSSAGFNIGVIGTISYKYPGYEVPAHHTTPESSDLQKLFSNMVDKKVNCCVIEVSSHSLALDRVKYCEFDTAIFSNLSHEHLDFHRTDDEYFKAKLKLFIDYPLKKAVINVDDEYGRKIVQLTGAEVLTYAIENKADIVAKDITIKPGRLTFTAKTPCGDIAIQSNLIGIHNVYNILAVIGVSIGKDIPLEQIKNGIEKCKAVPGRFESIDEGQDFLVVVDYAHTDDALRNVLSTAKSMTSAKLITVFGCGGDRDKSKRHLMGKISAGYSDHTVITSDNPRTESPMKIIKEIEIGLKETTKDDSTYTIIENRQEAIEFAIKLAKTDDVVVVAGKGHEDYQILADKKIHFDDREVVRNALSTGCQGEINFCLH